MYKENIQHRKVLILGAGQVGVAIANQLIHYDPVEIVLHTRTETELSTALARLKNQGSKTKIGLSWGDVFLPYRFMQRSALDSNEIRELNRFYYDELNDKILAESALHNLIANQRPDIVIDSVNTATVLGSENDPYTTFGTLQKMILAFEKVDDVVGVVEKFGSQMFVPKLVRFVQSLQGSMTKFGVSSYIKVSTTGLGGMGLNIQYTHGDTKNYNLSNHLSGKISAAGILHQLLWALSHTPGLNIKLIIPATLIGWNEIRSGKFENINGLAKSADCSKPVPIQYGKNLSDYVILSENSEFYQMPVVASGENKEYSFLEMTAITAVGQMEAIAKEEVAESVVACVLGRDNNNILVAMDRFTLGPTYGGKEIRDTILKKLENLVEVSGIPSIATGNLGPTVAKHLFELYILKAASNNTLSIILKTTPSMLAENCRNYIINNDVVRKQALSIGLPILWDDNHILIGSEWIVPNSLESQTVSSEAVNKWSEQGWIDLRNQSVLQWQERLSMVYNDAQYRKKENPNPFANAEKITDDFNIGEYLGYFYTVCDAGRHILSKII